MQCCHTMQQHWFNAIWVKLDTKQSLLLLRCTQDTQPLMTEGFFTNSSSFLFISVGWRVVVVGGASANASLVREFHNRCQMVT